jgi:hypothetical protein
MGPRFGMKESLGKDAPTRSKVKCETLILPAAQGGLGIIDPEA